MGAAVRGWFRRHRSGEDLTPGEMGMKKAPRCREARKYVRIEVGEQSNGALERPYAPV